MSLAVFAASIATAQSAVGGIGPGFVENRGQAAEGVLFHSIGCSNRVWLLRDGAILRPRAGAGSVRIRLVGCGSEPQVSRRSRSRTLYNFLRGDPSRWRTAVRGYGEIVYREVCPGVDVAFTLAGGRLAYRLEGPGPDVPGVVVIDPEDEASVREGQDGWVVVGAAPDWPGDARSDPGSWPASAGEAADAGDPADPEIRQDASTTTGLLWSSTLGSISHNPDIRNPYLAMVMTPNQEPILAGETGDAAFPSVPGSYDEDANGSNDAVVVRFDATGSDLVWATFLGGSDADGARAVALKDDGEVVVAGYTRSSDFPTLAGAYDRVGNGGRDIFVVGLSPDGSELRWGTLVGGAANDESYALALDPAGRPVITGYSESNDYPTTAGAYDTSRDLYQDVIATKLTATGSDLVWSTFIGGRDNDYGHGVAIDEAGCPIVVGLSEGSFPSTPGSFDDHQDGRDGFAAKLSADGSQLLWSTFIGGGNWDYALAVALDSGGHPLVTGWTLSSDFPVTAGAFDGSPGGGGDAFVVKLGADGDRLEWATYLGGGGTDSGLDIAVDPADCPVVTGASESNDFPVTLDGYDRTYNGRRDIFLCKLAAAGDDLLWSTLMGGAGDEAGGALAIGANGRAAIGGATTSSSFPTTPGAFDEVVHYGDGFVATFALPSPASATALLTPASGQAITTCDIPFSWSDVGADFYELWVDDDADFSSPEIEPFHFAPFAADSLRVTSFDWGCNWLFPGAYHWKVRASFDGVYQESEPWTFTYDPEPEAAPLWGPIYRLYNPTDRDHFYCSSEGHQQIAQDQGYREERVEGFFSLRRFDDADAVPLFRFYDDARDCHYYTSRTARVDSLIDAGLRYEGIIGWAWSGPQPGLGLVPLHHLSAPGLIDNLYTTSESERQYVEAALQFAYQDAVAHVSPAGDTCPVPANLQTALAGTGISVGTGNFQHYQGMGISIPSIGLPLEFTHLYNSQGVHLLSAVEPLGPGWSHTYNAYVLTADGQWLVCWPDGSRHRYSQATGECLDRVYGVYDELEVLPGGVFEITRKDQVVYRFERPAGTTAPYPSLLVSIRDRNQNAIACEYEEAGLRRLTRVIGPAGRELTFTYDSDPMFATRITAVTDVAGGRTLRFAYEDSNGDLTRFTDCDGAVTEYAYDETSPQDHQLSRIVLPNGNTIDNTYAERRVTGQSWTGQSLSLTREGSAVTVTDGEGERERFSCDALGRVEEILDQSGTTGAIAISREDTVNPALPTRIVDRNGNVTTVSYDQRGNVLAITRPLGVSHGFQYDALNDVIRHTDPRGYQTHFGYDAGGNLTSATDPLGAVTSYGRRPDGLLSQVTDPLSRTTHLAYDQHGNLISVQDPLGHTRTLAYDEVGRLLSEADEEGFRTSYTYDCADRLTSREEPTGGLTTYAYDANGNLERVTDAEQNLTTWTYNALDLPIGRLDAAGGQVSWSYRQDGSLAGRNLGNGAVAYGYDDSGRLSGITSTGAVLGRDDNGNIVGLNDAGGTMSFTYDALDRLTSYQDYDLHTVGYGYDAAGHVTRITYEPGKDVTYGYDAAGRLATVEDWLGNLTRYDYDADGSLASITYPNGVVASFGYDGAGRPVSLAHVRSDASVIASFTCTRDGRGRIVGEERQGPLATPVLAYRNVQYGYGPGNRLLSAGEAGYSYDAAGNVVGRTGPEPLTLSYDLENRLTEISGSASARFSYDTFGQRRRAVRDADTTAYVVDVLGMGNVLIEKDGRGDPLHYYVHGLGLVSRIDPDGSVRHYHADQVGSVVAMTDENQGVTHAYVYDPYGDVVASLEADGNPFRYVGTRGVMAEGAGLSYMRARYYERSTGRFTAADPIWDANLYVYAGGNPLSRIDPDGRRSVLGDVLKDAGYAFLHLATLGHAFKDKVDPSFQVGVGLGKGAAGLIAPGLGATVLVTDGAVAGAGFSYRAFRDEADPYEALDTAAEFTARLLFKRIRCDAARGIRSGIEGMPFGGAIYRYFIRSGFVMGQPAS